MPQSLGSKSLMLAGAHEFTHCHNFDFTSSTELAQGQKGIIAPPNDMPSLGLSLDTP